MPPAGRRRCRDFSRSRPRIGGASATPPGAAVRAWPSARAPSAARTAPADPLPGFASGPSGTHIPAEWPSGGRPLPRPMVRLEISSADGSTRTVPVDRSPFSIGAAASSNLTLAASGIAPQHAQIVLLGGVCHLLPAVPGAPLSADGAPVTEGGVALAHGARIALGPSCPYRLRVLIQEADAGDREDRLVTLMEVARTITSSQSVEDILDRVLEEVAATGAPVYRDVATGEFGQQASDSIVRLRLQAILCLPLAVRQDVIGVVYLDSRRRLPHHRPDLPLLEALAGLASVAIQNS